jgi:F-box/leucine-rich repeat protein 5
MPPRHDEANVFKIPHGRMKQLVNACNNKLIVTDFADIDALFVLLTSLQGVFKEFKLHEEIENEFIMKKLKSKLSSLAIHNSAVCNCHTEDEFTPLLDLVDIGYMHVNKAKTTSEKINFGVKLRKALNQFTKRFVPHMEEEEEVFQPLLMQHFTIDELVEMKILVIKSHMQQRKTSSKSSDVKMSQEVETTYFDDLPTELVLNIFSYLTKSEMLKAAKVCVKWNDLVYNKSNWKCLDFSDWLGVDGELSGMIETSNGQDIEYLDDSDEEYEDEPQKVWIALFA